MVKMPMAQIITMLLLSALLVLPACTNSISSDNPANVNSISISPSPGAYLTNTQDVSSEVLLKDVQINKGVSDKQYYSTSTGVVNVGEAILVVSGSIQNKHKEYNEIAMWARGYGEGGEQVAWTLDAAHIVGQIGLHLEAGETSEFTLHLYYSKNVNSIRIYANNYPVTPP